MTKYNLNNISRRLLNVYRNTACQWLKFHEHTLKLVCTCAQKQCILSLKCMSSLFDTILYYFIYVLNNYFVGNRYIFKLRKCNTLETKLKICTNQTILIKRRSPIRLIYFQASTMFNKSIAI
jgi:hypothetical protein